MKNMQKSLLLLSLIYLCTGSMTKTVLAEYQNSIQNYNTFDEIPEIIVISDDIELLIRNVEKVGENYVVQYTEQLTPIQYEKEITKRYSKENFKDILEKIDYIEFNYKYRANFQGNLSVLSINLVNETYLVKYTGNIYVSE